MVKNISLKTRMALSVTLLFVVFSAGTAFFSISYFEGKFKQSLADHQYTLAFTIADAINDKLVMLQSSLVAASKNVPPDIARNPAKAKRFVEERVTLHALFDTTVFVLDPKGMIVAESPQLPDRRVFDLSFREYYQKTIATRKPVISSPYASSLPDRRPVVMLTAPVFDSRGKLTCILCGGLRLLGSNLLSEVKDIHIGKSGYIYLFSSDRTMIIHPDRTRILKVAARPGANKLFDRALTGFDGSGETVNSQGIPMLVSFRHLTATNWIAAVNFPLMEAYAPMYRTRQFLLGGITAGMLAMLMIAWLVMKRLTTPLQIITRHVVALPEKTGPDKLIALDSGDEIGTLARAFNDMVIALDDQQKSLRESENNFRALAETALDGMLVIDRKGTVAYANCRIEEITGYTTYELPRHGIATLAHPDDCGHLLEHTRKMINGDEVEQLFEIRILRKDGSVVPVEITSTLTLWQGAPADLMMVRDISERRRIEKALRESHTLMQKTFASLNEAVFIVETGTRIIQDCNATVETMFGYKREEMIGATTSCLHETPEMSDRFGSAMLQSYAERGYFETIYRMKRKDGTVFDSEHFVTPIRDDNNEIVSHVCVVRDITERVKSEEAIRAALTLAKNEKARTEAIIAAIGEGIIVQDREYKILYQNEIHKSLIGDHHGEHCYRVYQGRSEVCPDCPVEMAFQDGAVHTVEKQIEICGNAIDLEVTASPLRDVTGTIVACIELVRDITERKQSEKAIIDLNRDLNQRANELAVVNSELEAFGYSLSHDLKGPLTAIYSGAQVLEDLFAEQLNETGRFCIQSICMASERMEELLEAMLLLSRISRSELKLEEVDLSDLALFILSRLQMDEPERRVVTVVEPGLKVKGDLRLLKSALENLLGNAWKYTRKKSEARIEFGAIVENNERIFFVRDNGAGFVKQNSEKMFLPFQRLHKEKEFEGTGIGLATVQRIIRRHDGKIWGEGEPDKGATFYFTLRDS